MPLGYKDYVDVFRKDRALTLVPHRPIDHAIDLEPGLHIGYGRIYNLSGVELKTLKAHIETNLSNAFIWRTSSPVAAVIVFAKKNDGGQQLCVDYRALNRATVKNQYPLPQISEMLDRLRGSWILMKLRHRNANHLIRIREVDDSKTAFHILYGQFEGQVMPFGLSYAPATFQAHIDDCLRPFIDDFTVHYLDDTLIYMTNEEDNEEQVQKCSNGYENLASMPKPCSAIWE